MAVKKILIQEKIGVKEDITVSMREHSYFAFWFIVKQSLENAKNNKDHRTAYLYNAAIMCVASMESLMNDLSEEYLPTNIFESLNKEQITKERIKKMINALSGQNGNYHIDFETPERKKEISKIDLYNLFQNKNWQGFLKLLEIRNKIIHRKVENIVRKNDDKDPIKDIREKWKIDLEAIEPNIELTKCLFLDLKGIFTKSIYDFVERRLTSRFDFIDHA